MLEKVQVQDATVHAGFMLTQRSLRGAAVVLHLSSNSLDKTPENPVKLSQKVRMDRVCPASCPPLGATRHADRKTKPHNASRPSGSVKGRTARDRGRGDSGVVFLLDQTDRKWIIRRAGTPPLGCWCCSGTGGGPGRGTGALGVKTGCPGLPLQGTHTRRR